VLALNVVLSTLFAVSIAWGMGFVGFLEFNFVNTATIAILLFAVAYAISK